MSGLLPFFSRSPSGAPVLRAGTEDASAETLSLAQPDVMLVLGDQPPESGDWGAVFVTTQRVIWLSQQDPAKGFAVDFVSLGVHALCRDPESYPRECIYLQIDHSGEEEEDDDAGDNLEEGDEEDGDGEGEAKGEESEQSRAESRVLGEVSAGPGTAPSSGPVPSVPNGHTGVVGGAEVEATLDPSRVEEMRLIPRDPATLDALFQCLSMNAALNPDPEGEREGEGDFFFDEDEVLRGAAMEDGTDFGGVVLGEATSTDTNHRLPNPELLPFEEDVDQFDDADEEDEYMQGD